MEEATENQRKEFEVGDMVRSPLLGVGVVTEVNDSDPTYPIKVEWTKDALYPRTHSVFYITRTLLQQLYGFSQRYCLISSRR